MAGEFDGPDDPMCGKPWADHNRIGECPSTPEDRRSLRWVGAILAVLAVLAIASVIANR